MRDDENNDKKDAVSSATTTLKQGLRTTVSETNKILAKVQEQVEKVRKPLEETANQITDAGSKAAVFAADAYDRRHEFGPAAVVGTSLTAGAITTLRRGKFPGLISATLFGGIAYGIIYGVDDLEPLKQLRYPGQRKD